MLVIGPVGIAPGPRSEADIPITQADIEIEADIPQKLKPTFKPTFKPTWMVARAEPIIGGPRK